MTGINTMDSTDNQNEQNEQWDDTIEIGEDVPDFFREAANQVPYVSVNKPTRRKKGRASEWFARRSDK